MVSANDIISTVVGNGATGYSGDGGPASKAQLYAPGGVAVDALGNLYISDTGNNRVRKVSAANGTITTVAGNGVAGYSGDGGPATSAQLNNPFGVAVDSSGNLYITDTRNLRIRKVSTGGIISTIAGNGTAGFSGDGGPATSAQLASLFAVTLDNLGNLYFGDNLGGGPGTRVRKVSLSGIIRTVAGGGPGASSGDGGPATSAVLGSADALAFDNAGNLFIGDTNRVRRVSSGGTIATIAGNGTFGYTGDGGPAIAAQLDGEYGLAVDGSGNIYVADTGNDAIRLLTLSGPSSILVSAVANAASNTIGPIAPGEIVTIYGSGIGPLQLTTSALDSSGLIPTQVANTQVSFNGILAPIIYTWAPAVSVIVPYEITGVTAQVSVTYQGQTSAATTVPIVSCAPGLFVWELLSSGKGQALVVNQDGSINSVDTPAEIGSIVTLYATGEGQTSPGG